MVVQYQMQGIGRVLEPRPQLLEEKYERVRVRGFLDGEDGLEELLADCSHHSDSVPAPLIQHHLHWLVHRTPGAPIAQPQVERGFVKVDEWHPTSSQLRKFDHEVLELGGVLQCGLLVLIADHQIAEIVFLVEQLQTHLDQWQVEFFCKQNAALVQTQAAPLLKNNRAEQICGDFWCYLVPLVVPPVVDAPVLQALVLQHEAPQCLMHRGLRDQQNTADLTKGLLQRESQVEHFLGLQLLNLAIGFRQDFDLFGFPRQRFGFADEDALQLL
jgi:hypothetical protein